MSETENIVKKQLATIENALINACYMTTNPVVRDHLRKAQNSIEIAMSFLT